MPELSKQEQAHLLEAVIRQAEIRDAKLAVLRDPTKLAAMCEMATCAEDATEGIWFRFDEGSPHADWNRFLDEDNDRGKVLLAARGTAKSTFGRMKMAAKYAEDHDFTLFYGGETAVNVGKRSVRMRTMLTRKAFTEGYGIAPTMQDWGSKTFTVQRPMGPGDPPSLEVTSPDKPGTGSHYRHRMLDDPNGEKSFMSQKYAEQAERWYQSMQAQSMGKTKEWILNTPWPGKTIVRTIRDEVEGGFTWEKYGRCWIHRGEEYDVLKVGVYDEMGKPLWDFLPEKVLKRIRRKLHSQ